jgi:hypothetical protein
MSAIAAHRPGPKSIQPDGQPAYEGLRGMRLCQQGKTLLTGEQRATFESWEIDNNALFLCPGQRCRQTPVYCQTALALVNSVPVGICDSSICRSYSVHAAAL